jgi:hypothetical protein
MERTTLRFDAEIAEYRVQAEALLEAYRARDPKAVGVFRHRLPRFLRVDVPWLPRELSDAEILEAGLDLADAELAVARVHDFRDWPSLVAHVAEVTRPGSEVQRFEAAVEAVITGDLPMLASSLAADPALVRARSTRVTHFDPPIHRATLLHYVAANGVEAHRQRTPANAVEVATALLRAGAEVDALADLYGGRCTTMNLLVSSAHPARAGVQGCARGDAARLRRGARGDRL